ncbi:MAG: transglutaminase family protein [Planctomycetota bacterium]
MNDLLAMDDHALENIDPLEMDLAVARTTPGCESLDVERYKHTVDRWAEHVRQETDRYLYKFQQKPADYNDSLAYFKALVLATVIGQDFKVSYHVESITFDDPQDLFIHGIIDSSRGTCVSLPVLYMALGWRLGYPIKAVTVPKHIFCRWEDPKTGERFNIEAAGAGGLADHPDEYYKTWPTPLHDKDIESGSALKTLTMREFLGLKIATRGDYFWKKNMKAEAITSYALAHQLFPTNRTTFEILVSQVMEEAQLYPWSITNRIATQLSEKRIITNNKQPKEKESS